MPAANSGAPPRLTAVDLFAGVGGMSLGFEQAGFDILSAIDADPIHLAAHGFNFPHAEPVCQDVRALTGDAVLQAAERGWRRLHTTGLWSGRIDCITGGPSCQGFSVIGRKDPLDARNDLVFAFARIVRELAPRYFVLENVPGLLSPAYRPLMARLLSEFETAGYDLGRGPLMLNARSYGVPQDRKRIFIVGSYRGEYSPSEPPALDGSTTALDALADLPDADSFAELINSDEVELARGDCLRLETLASRYVRLLRDDNDEQNLSVPRAWDRSTLTSSRRTLHAPEVVRRFRSLVPGACDPIARLTRLHPAEPSPTLRAGTGRDHGSFTSARPIHYQVPRVITVREAARLHSFPDWFRFHTTKWHGFRQVGNAVPPHLARAVARQVALAATDRNLNREATPTRLGDPSVLSMSPMGAAEYFGIDPGSLPADGRQKRPVHVARSAA